MISLWSGPPGFNCWTSVAPVFQSWFAVEYSSCFICLFIYFSDLSGKKLTCFLYIFYVPRPSFGKCIHTQEFSRQSNKLKRPDPFIINQIYLWDDKRSLTINRYMDRVKRIWYLSPMRAAKVQASLRIRAVSPEPSLLAHTSSESRGTFRQKARSLAPLNGWACAVEICHDGMLEDTNSLDGAHIFVTPAMVYMEMLVTFPKMAIFLNSCLNVKMFYKIWFKIIIVIGGPLVLYRSPECWWCVKISVYWGKEV